MSSQELEHLIQIVDKLSHSERQQLATYLARSQPMGAGETDEELWTNDQIQQMLTPKPRTGHEIVELGLQSGAIGSWQDMDIADPVEWLKQQRQTRFQW